MLSVFLAVASVNRRNYQKKKFLEKERTNDIRMDCFQIIKKGKFERFGALLCVDVRIIKKISVFRIEQTSWFRLYSIIFIV